MSDRELPPPYSSDAQHDSDEPSDRVKFIRRCGGGGVGVLTGMFVGHLISTIVKKPVVVLPVPPSVALGIVGGVMAFRVTNVKSNDKRTLMIRQSANNLGQVVGALVGLLYGYNKWPILVTMPVCGYVGSCCGGQIGDAFGHLIGAVLNIML